MKHNACISGILVYAERPLVAKSGPFNLTV